MGLLLTSKQYLRSADVTPGGAQSTEVIRLTFRFINWHFQDGYV